MGKIGLINKAKEAKKQNAIAAKKEEVQMAINGELLEKEQNGQEVTISNVLESIKNNYKEDQKNSIEAEATGEEEDKFPGKIIYNKPSSTINESIIVEVNEDLSIGEVTILKESSNKGSPSSYTKVGGVYCQSPDLSGFNISCTYYVTYDSEGTQTSENVPISKEAPDEWYDYSIKKWANIVTINNGNKTYWVWIPRFKYSIDNSTKTTNVKFVTTEDKYYEDTENEKMVDRTSTLDSTYQISEAFKFNNQELAGYWVSKYKVAEGTNDGTARASTDTIKNIQVDLSGFNQENTYYVTYDDEGKQTSEDTKISDTQPKNWYDYSIKKWANIMTNNNGNKTYWTYIPRYEYQMWKELKQTNIRYIKPNVTQTNADKGFSVPESFTFNGQELKGYWVSKYKVAEGTNDETAIAYDDSLNQIDVDLSGFNKLTTYYVTYDDNGTQTSENIPISQPQPTGWYDYSKKKWANVMTNNNGLKTYWTYIPRYEYQMWKGLKKTNIRFISPSITQSNADSGFYVSDAFKFGNQQLKGYWVSKYKIQSSTPNSQEFDGQYYK